MQVWALDDGTDFVEWFATEAEALAYLEDMQAVVGAVDMRPQPIELPSAAALCERVNDAIRRAGRLW